MDQKINFFALMKKKSRWSAWLVPSHLLLYFFSFLGILTMISLKDIRQAYTAALVFSDVSVMRHAAENRLSVLIRHAGGGMSDSLIFPSVTIDAGSPRYIPDILKALSLTSVNGLWLTFISVSVPDNKLTLEGETRKPAGVQSLLQNLSGQPVFRSMNFQLDGLKERARTEPDGMPALTFRIVATG